MSLSLAHKLLLAQTEADVLSIAERSENLACAGDRLISEGNLVCRQVFRLTGNGTIASAAGTIVPAVVRTIVILAIAMLVVRVLRRLIKRFVKDFKQRGVDRLSALARKGPLTDTAPINLERATMRADTMASVLRSVATFVVWGIAAVMILGSFGFNLGPLLAGAGVAGVALGFGAQSLVKDFLSGIFMILEDQFGVGDIVDVGEASGTVEAVTLRSTRIRDVSGTLWHVPNGEIRRVGNMSQLWSRALLDIGVAYDTDIDRASAIMKGVADEMAAEEEWAPFFVDGAEVWGVQAFAENEVTIRIAAKVTPAKQWAIEREYRARIKRAFDEAGIVIPLPQRTIWVRSEDTLQPGDPPSGTAAS